MGATAIQEHLLKSYHSFDIQKSEESSDFVTIEGYASTIDKDRHDDVIPPNVWNGEALKDYRKNPILLAYHNRRQPVGKCIDISVTEKGLYVKAEVLADSEVGKLVAAGILKTFSIGFRLLDWDYNPTIDAWVIKKVELMEISIVALPANTEAMFDVSKQLGDIGKDFINSVKEKRTMNKENKSLWSKFFGSKNEEEVKEDMKGVSEEVTNLKGQVDTLTTEKTDLENKVKDLEKQIEESKELANKVKSLEDALEANKTDLEEKETALTANATEIENITKERDSLQAKIDKSQGKKSNPKGGADPEVIPSNLTANQKAYKNNEEWVKGKKS